MFGGLWRWLWGGTAAPAGGLVCGTVSVVARVGGTVSVVAKVSGTAGVAEC